MWTAASHSGVHHLTTHYYQFDVLDPAIRTLTVKNPYVDDPRVTVTGSLRFPDREPTAEDWTHLRERHLCRDRLAERVETVEVIVENHDWQRRAFTDAVLPNVSIEVYASNVGCWRWQGTATAVTHTETRDLLSDLSVVEDLQVSADVSFERFVPPVPVPASDAAYFDVAAGLLDVQVVETTTFGEVCEVSASFADVPIEDGTLRLRLTAAQGDVGHYWGWNSQTVRGPATSTCGGERQKMVGATWFSVDEAEQLHVSADGSRIEGHVERPFSHGDGEYSVTGLRIYDWHFEALRE
jgi:hypothetical protein